MFQVPPLLRIQISASSARSQLFIKMRQRGTADLQGKDLLLPLAATVQMFRLAAFGFDPFFVFFLTKERNLYNGKIKALFFIFSSPPVARDQISVAPPLSSPLPLALTHTCTHPRSGKQRAAATLRFRAAYSYSGRGILNYLVLRLRSLARR